MKLLFIIDEIELKYFEFNVLVTNFWLIYEFLLRDIEVFITTKTELYLKNSTPYAACFKAYTRENNIFYEKKSVDLNLNQFNIIFVRPDPPVDVDYINATYVLDYVSDDTFIMNNPKTLRDKNEKIYVNEFEDIMIESVVTSKSNIIKEFLFKENEIILKPLNRCFSSGVFYLNKHDKNINTIINTITNSNKTKVMVQKFLPEIKDGDKRFIFICGEILPYAVSKVATNDDFKFNEHTKENLLKYETGEIGKKIENVIKDKFLNDGIYLAGLDVVSDKVLEINITSPAFFINEINSLFDVKLEQIVADKILSFVNAKNELLQQKVSIT